MPSKFGGVPVESSGSKFGGVPVDEKITELEPVEVRGNPTEGMSPTELNLAGLGESLDTAGRGIRDTVTDMGRYFVESNPMLFDESAAQGMRDRVAAQQAQNAEREQLNAPLNATAAGKTGNIVGTVAQFVTPGGLAKLGARVPQMVRAAPALARAGRSLLPSTVKGAAAQGAVVGALQPVNSSQQRAVNAGVGGVAGAGGAGIPLAVGAVARRASGLIPAVTANRQNVAAANVLNQFAADSAALRAGAMNPQVIVPGSMPTLAEATGDVGLAGLQRTLANSPEYGNLLFQRNQANNLARVNALEGAFGGADETASAAVRGERDRAANIVLKPAAKVGMSSLNKVLAGVSRLAEKNPANESVQVAMEAVKTRLPLIRNVADAHDVRQYVNQLIGGQVEGKAGAKFAKGQLLTVRGLLDREMRAAYPEWGTFLRDYKSLSREADQIDVGAELLGTGRAVRNSTNTPDLTPAAFGRAAGNMDRTVQRATGFNRATAERTLTKEQLGVVDSVRRDLERYSRASTDGKAIGSNTVQNALGGNTFQSAVGPVGAAVIEPISGIAMMGLNQLRKGYGEKVAGIVQEAMLDPSRAAEILATLPPAQRQSIIRQMARYIPRAGGVAGVSAVPASE